ncbi:MAG TPA: pyridoxamine 5'-phosphate oxidase family protein [Patescibacteria group bacterium]|nr:pyridoxamine 5'-phosphate oxidase family protein [Patescibacteria group bacterium]
MNPNSKPSDPTGEPASPLPKGDLRFVIRSLVRSANTAALATTLAGEARPYVSLVTVATDIDGSPLLLLSRLADHTRNIDDDRHVSLLFDGTAGFANPQQGPRVTILGKIEHCNEARTRRRFLARHPGAALYADFADFAFYRVHLDRAHWVGGFARAVWLDDRLPCDFAAASDFAAAEPELLARLNDSSADMLTVLANGLLKRRGKGWRMVAIDPDGCDLAHGKTVLRLGFNAPLGRADEAPATLAALVESVTGIS